MPANGHAGGSGGPGQTRKLLLAVDASLPAGAPVPDAAQLATAAAAAVTAGGGHVLNTTDHTFDNGAVTLVLILAESHLAVHTWPEESLVAIDLFSCGAIDPHQITAELVRRLGLTSARTSEVPRA